MKHIRRPHAERRLIRKLNCKDCGYLRGMLQKL